MQIAELLLIRPREALALIYYTCVNSILAIVLGLTLAGAVAAIARLSFKNWWSPQCEFVNKLNYWYWKALVLTQDVVCVLLLNKTLA
ncbi:hypothetical protein AAHH88_00235 [Candidatus Hodgkinia cicadicola]